MFQPEGKSDLDTSVLWAICVLVGCVVCGDAPSARHGHPPRMGFPLARDGRHVHESPFPRLGGVGPQRSGGRLNPRVIGSLKTFCEAVSGMGAREGAASLSRSRVPAGGAKLISSLPPKSSAY